MTEENYRLQLAETLETFRYLTGLTTARFGFLVALGSALWIFGMEYDQRVMLWASSSVTLGCIWLWLVNTKRLVVLGSIALGIERQLGIERGLVDSYVSACHPKMLKLLSTPTLDPSFVPARPWQFGGLGLGVIVVIGFVQLLTASFLSL